MYGMLLESIQHFIQRGYGEDVWNKVLEEANLHNTVFTTHTCYSDHVMVDLASACAHVIDKRSHGQYMRYFGQCFVRYFTHYGYDRLLRVSGRHFRDFLHGIDNIHETMRFSYPKMCSPSFCVEQEDNKGCVLHYRSKRKGFTQYVVGQIEQCSLLFYNIAVEVVKLREECTEQGCHVTYRLNFDNSAFKGPCSHPLASSVLYKTIPAAFFFKVFPFCIVFNSSMRITHTGAAISQLFDHDPLLHADVRQKFKLRRPLMDFTWKNVLHMHKVAFELKSLVYTKHSIDCDSKKCLLLKGEMKYISDFSGMAFLCTPLMSGVDELEAVGLYINELNMYDSSRDMVIAGHQHASRLEYSIERQVDKSQKIEENLKKLDAEKRKSENLLYSMIPRSVAISLKNGVDPVTTCKVFDSVTIMFAYMLGFTELCSSMSAICLVQCINAVFCRFDAIIDSHDVFKVETLGDAVYMVAGGIPERQPDHAYAVVCVAKALVENTDTISMPPEIMSHKLKIRVGIHTGSVVAGVVGRRMPQYCLFGDAVNTASRMQTHSEADRIHLSETCKKCLTGTDLVCVYRGKIHIKGKGDMNTYWLAGYNTDKDIITVVNDLRKEAKNSRSLERMRSVDSFNFRKTKSVVNFKTSLSDPNQYNGFISNIDDGEERELPTHNIQAKCRAKCAVFRVSSDSMCVLNETINPNTIFEKNNTKDKYDGDVNLKAGCAFLNGVEVFNDIDDIYREKTSILDFSYFESENFQSAQDEKNTHKNDAVLFNLEPVIEVNTSVTGLKKRTSTAPEPFVTSLPRCEIKRPESIMSNSSQAKPSEFNFHCKIPEEESSSFYNRKALTKRVCEVGIQVSCNTESVATNTDDISSVETKCDPHSDLLHFNDYIKRQELKNNFEGNT